MNYLAEAIESITKESLLVDEIPCVTLEDAIKALEDLEVAILNYMNIKKIKEEKNNLY